MSLYTVHFTTQAPVHSYDHRGKKIGITQNDTPVTITALPHSTAQSYKGCDNFRMEPYVMGDKRFASKGSGRDASVGNGTKKSYTRTRRDEDFDGAVVVAKTSAQKAAETGSLAEAINAR